VPAIIYAGACAKKSRKQRGHLLYYFGRSLAIIRNNDVMVIHQAHYSMLKFCLTKERKFRASIIVMLKPALSPSVVETD
jgi:hypothetical protein